MLKNAHSTLEELEISTGGGESRYLGSLRKFTKLKTLTIDSGMLIYRGKMQRAVDVLPASVELVTLTGNSLTRNFEEQLLMDLYRPSCHYPKLRRLSVDDSWVGIILSKSTKASNNVKHGLILINDVGQARHWEGSSKLSEGIS